MLNFWHQSLQRTPDMDIAQILEMYCKVERSNRNCLSALGINRFFGLGSIPESTRRDWWTSRAVWQLQLGIHNVIILNRTIHLFSYNFFCLDQRSSPESNIVCYLKSSQFCLSTTTVFNESVSSIMNRTLISLQGIDMKFLVITTQ